MKERESKLDTYAEKLDAWFGEQKLTLAQAQTQLAALGVRVSISRLGAWWQARCTKRQQDQLLSRIASGARQCREVEQSFAKNPAPEFETLIKLHRVLILQLSTESTANPELLELVNKMMKPVIAFASLQQKEREHELALSKYRDQVAERKRALEAELVRASSTGGIQPETLKKIEAELRLL